MTLRYIGKFSCKFQFKTQCPPPVQLLEIFLSVPVPFSPSFSYYFHVSLSPVGRLLLRHPQNRSNLSSSKSSQWKLSTLARGWRNWPRTSRACAGGAAAPASPLAVRRRSRRAAGDVPMLVSRAIFANTAFKYHSIEKTCFLPM